MTQKYSRQQALEQENAELKEQLLLSQQQTQYYRQVLQALPAELLLIDVDERIGFANQALLQMFGYPEADEMMGRGLRELMDLEGKKTWTTQAVPALRNDGCWRGEISVVRHASKSASASANVFVEAVNIVAGQDCVLATVLAFQDVSSQRQLEEQLYQAQKMEAIGTLAGGIAHDMNNVLSAIFNLGTLLKMNATQYGDSFKQDVEDIIYAAKRGRDLSRDLLGFARKGNFLKQRLNFNDIVEEVRKLLSRTVSHVDVQLLLDDSLPLVEGDHGQLSHALMNICLNAADAISDKGVISISTRTVKLGAADLLAWPQLSAGHYIKADIIDTGEGMDANVLGHAFEPFFTTKEMNKGTGLGLSMVYGTMKSHDGAVLINSKKGAGTKVTLLLPCSRNTSTPMRTTGQFKVSRQECTGRILLVDDEQMIRRSAARLLAKLGYDVLVAANGVEAIEVVENEGANLRLVILDLIMPGMDGEKTYYRLREMDASLPILISSGFSKGEKVDRLIRDGAAGFVQKPFELGDIAEQIAEQIRAVPAQIELE